MDRAKWLAIVGFGYVLWTGFGLVEQLGGESRSVQVSSSNPNARATLAGGIERINWESKAIFADFHGSTGAGRQNSALTEFARKNNIDMGNYKEMESSFSRLAASLNPFEARQDYLEAQRSGAAPEVVSHFQYLLELAEAFQQGRLPELLRRWFGTQAA